MRASDSQQCGCDYLQCFCTQQTALVAELLSQLLHVLAQVDCSAKLDCGCWQRCWLREYIQVELREPACAAQSALGADQLSWLLNDLARVDRSVTPWVTVSWHQPPVSSPYPAPVYSPDHSLSSASDCMIAHGLSSMTSAPLLLGAHSLCGSNRSMHAAPSQQLAKQSGNVSWLCSTTRTPLTTRRPSA